MFLLKNERDKMEKNIILRINKAGAVILTTVSSFLVQPPQISADDSSLVHYHNLFSFLIGVFSILIVKDKFFAIKPRLFMYTLLVFVLCVAGAYEVMCEKYSIFCPGWNARVVISNAPMTKLADQAFHNYLNSMGPHEAIAIVVNNGGCDSSQVWNIADLRLPYYGLQAFYLLETALVTILVAGISRYVTKESKT